MTDPADRARARRNVLLFWAHVAVTVVLVAAFVFVQAQKG
jgi:hypothetical protein